MASVTVSESSGPRHDLSRALIITRREVSDMFRDWRIIIPIVVLTLIFPTIMNFTAGSAANFALKYGGTIVAERLYPFMLMVVGFFPISVSLVIALETFVGEKERRSLEPLLSTPMSDLQLYIGKAIAATLPPLLGSYLGIGVYLVTLYFNVGWLPPLPLLGVIVSLTTVQALVMVAGAVVVSSQTTSVRAANLLSSFIVVPMALLVQVESVVMFWARYNLLWVIIGGLLIIMVLLVRMGVRTFNREELLGSDIDDLNLKGLFNEWWHYVRGEALPDGARHVWRWYGREVLPSLRRTTLPALVVLLVLAGAALIGIQQAGEFPIPAAAFDTTDWTDNFDRLVLTIGLVGPKGVLLVVWQNVRVLLLATILAVFTFGVLSVVIAMLPIVIIAYLGANFYNSGLPVELFWASIWQHALLEVPAILLAAGGALRLGASVISPPPGKTMAQAWLLAAADLFKVWVGVILPILVGAAILEVYVTPAAVRALAVG